MKIFVEKIFKWFLVLSYYWGDSSAECYVSYFISSSKTLKLVLFFILKMKNWGLVTHTCSCYMEKLELDQNYYPPQTTWPWTLFSQHSKVRVPMLSCQTACGSLNTLFLVRLCLVICCFLCPNCHSLSRLSNEIVFTFYDSIPSLNSSVRIRLSLHF